MPSPTGTQPKKYQPKKTVETTVFNVPSKDTFSGISLTLQFYNYDHYFQMLQSYLCPLQE